MKTKKYLSALLAILMICTILGACAGKQPAAAPAAEAPAPAAAEEPAAAAEEPAEAAAVANVLDEKTLKIGVMHFTYTSRIATALMDYCKYLEDNMNVKFEYFTCGFDNDSCISTVENMITSGCDGIVTLVASGIVEMVSICEEAQVPLCLIQGAPTIAERAELEANPSDWLFIMHPETNPEESGVHMAEVMLEKGYTRCAVITAIEGMIEAGDRENAGFMDTFTKGGGTIVAEIHENPGPSMMTAADTVITQYGDDIDFIYGLLDVIQSAVTATDKDIKIVSNELPSDGGVQMFEDGVLVFAHEKIPQQIGLAVAVIVNKLNGQDYSDAPSYRDIEQKYTDITSVDDCKLFLKVTNGTDGCVPAWTIDEVKSCILAYNPDATWAELVTLAQSCQIADICTRHGY